MSKNAKYEQKVLELPDCTAIMQWIKYKNLSAYNSNNKSTYYDLFWFNWDIFN